MVMAKSAKLELNGQTYELPVVEGTEGQVGIDISHFYRKSGAVMLDAGYGNTASCKSAITYIDGDKGILRYRGIPIEQLAEKSTFVETAWLVIWGRLPTKEEAEHFSQQLTAHAAIHEDLRHHYEGFPAGAPPMAILSAMINALSCYHSDYLSIDEDAKFEGAAARLISQVRTLAAASYRKSIGAPMNYPRPDFKYCENFLHMMFSNPYDDYIPDPDVARALRTAPPRPCGWSPAPAPTSSPPAPPASARSGAPCTAAPTWRSSRCSKTSATPAFRPGSSSRR